MNQKQAIAALTRLFGKSAAWRYNDKAPKGEEREQWIAKLPALRATADSVRALRDARRVELLKDPEYVRLRLQAIDAGEALDQATSMSRARRVVVGKTTGIFFTVVAEGDNWQEAIDAARAEVGRS